LRVTVTTTDIQIPGVASVAVIIPIPIVIPIPLVTSIPVAVPIPVVIPVTVPPRWDVVWTVSEIAGVFAHRSYR
jgi:hypothetical protein